MILSGLQQPYTRTHHLSNRISLYLPYAWFVLAILSLLFLILNRQFFVFVYGEKGFVFLYKSILLNWFGYLYSGFGALLGLAAWFKKHIKRTKC